MYLETNNLAEKETLNLYDLKNERFICNNAGIDHGLTEAFCIEAGFRPNIVFESNESAFVGAWLEKERGVSLISSFDLFGLADRLMQVPLKAIRITKPEPVLTLGIAKAVDAEFSKGLMDFYNYAEEYFEKLDRDIREKWPVFWENKSCL